MGVFANCTFCLKVKHLPGQQKKKLQTDIKENGGNVSFLLNPQVKYPKNSSVIDHCARGGAGHGEKSK